jgi:hypothetical protein
MLVVYEPIKANTSSSRSKFKKAFVPFSRGKVNFLLITPCHKIQYDETTVVSINNNTSHIWDSLLPLFAATILAGSTAAKH